MTEVSGWTESLHVVLATLSATFLKLNTRKAAAAAAAEGLVQLMLLLLLLLLLLLHLLLLSVVSDVSNAVIPIFPSLTHDNYNALYFLYEVTVFPSSSWSVRSLLCKFVFVVQGSVSFVFSHLSSSSSLLSPALLSVSFASPHLSWWIHG